MTKPINSGEPTPVPRDSSANKRKRDEGDKSLNSRIAKVAKLLHAEARNGVDLKRKSIEPGDGEPLGFFKK